MQFDFIGLHFWRTVTVSFVFTFPRFRNLFDVIAVYSYTINDDNWCSDVFHSFWFCRRRGSLSPGRRRGSLRAGLLLLSGSQDCLFAFHPSQIGLDLD